MLKNPTQVQMIGRLFNKVAVRVFYFLIIFFVVRFFIFSPGKVNGRSMEPTLVDDDYFFVSKIHYIISDINRFDLVQIVDPASNKLLVKRVIGLPGERIHVQDGKITIHHPDGSQSKLQEPYLSNKNLFASSNEMDGIHSIQHDHFFVAGDNRIESVDSRRYGTLERSRILGKVIPMKKR